MEPLPDDPRAERRRQDLDLARAAVARDRAALDELMRRLEAVERILWSLNDRWGGALSATDLDDLTQDTLIIIWQKLPTFEGRATLETWAYRFCLLEYLNRARKLGRRGRLLGSRVPETGVAAPAPTAPPSYRRLELGIDELGEREAAVIRLKHFEDRTFDQIATALEVPPSTAKSMYYRGLARLRKVLVRARDEEEL